MIDFLLPKLHKEGYRFLAIAVVITFILLLISNFLGLISFVLTIWVYYFFRDPERFPINNESFLLAPADGIVSQITEVNGPKELGMERAVKVRASIIASDPYQERDLVMPDVNTCTRKAAKEAYEMAGVGPDDIDLVELHDCFATAEMLHYENLGLCKDGEAGRMIDEGEVELGGRVPVNVSGGLLSKGHPLGATGIANIYEVSTHLRGEAGERQVEGAKLGLTHVIGLGSACGIHILEKAN